ncbi:MAG TPA: GtrA family protein [Candidatus Moranbacteria bacterium]|nr:GtrA family protein [Candidatus Moranbacteria bacterium]HSA08510.1 GtrA family protein [Candidatus Moranbacteria bacterium]
MENTTGIRITQKDYYFSIAAGLLIGFLLLPILKALNPAIYAKFYLIIVPFFLLATPIGLRIAFFIGQKIAIIYQVAKFGLIGVLNTLVDLGFLTLITFIFSAYYNIESKTSIIGVITFYSLYKAASFIIANVNSYFWNKYWTFEQGGKKQTKSEFVQFFAVSIVGFLINVFIASFVFKIVLGSLVGLSAEQLGLIGAAAGSIAGLVWNFIGYKLWVFKSK